MNRTFWCVISPEFQNGYPCTWTIRQTRQASQCAFVENTSSLKSWRHSYRQGFRCRRVRIVEVRP